MSESPEAGTTAQPDNAPGGNGGSETPPTDTQAPPESGSVEASEETAKNAAKLLAAEVTRQQAETAALATGTQEHIDASADAQAAYEEVRESVDEDALRFAYATLLNPVGLADQTRQFDTTGLGGFGSSAGVVHAANVFGSNVQRAVAEMATKPDHDPVTVVGAVPQSDLVDPDSLERAQHGKKKRNKDQ